MRVIGLLMASILLGAGAIGAWFYFGPDGALPLVEKAPASRERSRIRYAPYVVLAPAETLPYSPPSARKPAQEKHQGSEGVTPSSPTRTTARTPQPPPAPAPLPEMPKPPPSEVARQTLEAIQGADEKPAAIPPPEVQEKAPPPSRITVEAAPKTVPVTTPAPPAQASAPVPAPKVVSTPTPSAPAKPDEEVNRATTRLKYEIETDRQAKAREKQKSLLARGTVRFRRVIPVSPGRLKAGQNMVLLAGVDALGANAQCSYPSGTKWDCGKWGTFALRRFIRSRSVVCDLLDEISPSEVTGRCKVGGKDVSKWIIRRGWGTPTQEMLNIYAADLDAAKAEKLGQWSVEPKSDS